MKTPKPRKAGAHIAPGQPERKAKADERRIHAEAPALSDSMRPARSRTTRSHRSASARSCVTRTSVMPITLETEQQVCDRLAIGLIEIAGRLVGHENGRIRARWRGQWRRAAARRPRVARDSGGGVRRVQPPAVRGWPAPANRCVRSIRPAARHSRARSWWGSGGRTGTRCRYCGPTKQREPVFGHVAQFFAGHPDAAGIRPFQPGQCISNVDLPEPEGPTRPTASPFRTSRLTPLRIWTSDAPRPRLNCTSRSATAAMAFGAGAAGSSRRDRREEWKMS